MVPQAGQLGKRQLQSCFHYRGTITPLLHIIVEIAPLHAGIPRPQSDPGSPPFFSPHRAAYDSGGGTCSLTRALQTLQVIAASSGCYADPPCYGIDNGSATLTPRSPIRRRDERRNPNISTNTTLSRWKMESRHVEICYPGGPIDIGWRRGVMPDICMYVSLPHL